MIRVMGLDISTKTGIAELVCPDDGKEIRMTHSGVITSKHRGLDRCSAMATTLMERVEIHKPSLVVIEGYGFANKHTLVTLVEIGTVLRYFLYQSDVRFINVPPNTLKKFVTGSGAAGKDQMIKEVFKRWGHDVSSNDVADAIGLAYLGMALHRVDVGLPKVNLSALDKVEFAI